MSIYYNGEAFFQSWKRGVFLAGPKWFGDGEDPAPATTKWQLAPRVDDIAAVIGKFSTSEGVFLAAMVSFYNDRIGGPWLQRAVGHKDVGMADIAASLDAPRRKVIADLLLSYCGW